MISDLVASLPEVYQPIYGHPELSGQISRPCDDRLEKIESACAALQAYLGRPLKVLDLGCAQGFFSLNLAEKGATVHGVDFLDKNIAVCNALAKEHPDLNASFETGRVEVAIQNLSAGEYDLVLGLSVFHHIVHENGIDAVKQLLDRIAKNCKALIVELALREEPLYWGSSQPEDPRTLLETIAYVHELARHGTHLAPIPRPLYFASNRYFLLNDRVEQFDSWSAEPHALARGTHEGSRRYFFSANNVLKLYRFDLPRGEHNKAEFELEKRFFNNPPSELSVPACREIGENDAEGWLLTERFPGRLLLDLLREGEKLDSRAVLLAVLDQLRKLEAAGLYHNDVRTWNVLVSEDGTPHLIDYGSISPKAEDCVWPRNPFLAFFIFVREVATGVVEDPDPLRT
ncbi:MAG TPA: class I SAM-dependent methyltransferase, partial [Zoogloea sp.]|nr:class I SAM-dependent methyltransferase [Zoogloea sp.]